MKDKKAAKKLLRLAKLHPEQYTKQEVYYAKQVRKALKKASKDTKQE